MSKRFLMGCLAALAFSAHAGPITFSNVQFDVTAVAITADGAPGFDTQSSPPSATPISASADSIGAIDIATAGAIGGPGLLSTSADVSAISGIGNAVATSFFSGSFLVDNGPVNLSIDFTTFDFAAGSGAAATSLFVNLVSDGVTLVDEFITGLWDFQYFAALGSTSVLSLTLISDVSAGFLAQGFGDASSSGLVTFSGVIPVPATLVLVLVGLAALATTRPRAPRAMA